MTKNEPGCPKIKKILNKCLINPYSIKMTYWNIFKQKHCVTNPSLFPSITTTDHQKRNQKKKKRYLFRPIPPWL